MVRPLGKDMLKLLAMKKIIGLIFAVIIVIGVFFYVRGQNNVPTVKSASVEKKDILLTIEASAVVEATQSAELKFEIPGRITWLPVREGETVKQWQAVASIDSRPLQIALDQARANWAKYAMVEQQLTEDYKDVVRNPSVLRTTRETQATTDYYWGALQSADLALKKP